MSDDNLSASFESGKFHVAWDFHSNEHDLQTYDRIEVREKNKGCEDIACAVQLTQSSLNSGRLTISPVAPLNMGDGLYYAVYINSCEEKEIARSEDFTASDLAAPTFEEKFLGDNEGCILNVIKVHPTSVSGKENCEIDIEWKFKDNTCDLLTKMDYLCVIPMKKIEDLKNVYHDHAFGLASGKSSGKVSIQLGGYVKVGHMYQVFYLLNHAVKGLVCKGASDPFQIENSMLPHFNNPSATKAASQKFNMSTAMQYVKQSQKETLEHSTSDNDNKNEVIEEKMGECKNVEDNGLAQVDEANAVDEAGDKLTKSNEKQDDDHDKTSEGTNNNEDIGRESENTEGTEDNDSTNGSEKDLTGSISTPIRAPLKKKKSVRVKKETVVKGVPKGLVRPVSTQKSRKAIQGEKTCDYCVIM